MRRKKSIYIFILIILFVSTFIVINLDKIKFTLSMVQGYKKSQFIVDNTNPLDESNSIISSIDNPLKEFLDKDIEDNIDVDDTDETKDTEDVADKKADNIPATDNLPIDNKIPDNQGLPNNPPSKEIKEIAKEYNHVFTSLESEFENKLNNLISTAYDEYKSGKLSPTKLASKYISQGTKLEKESDNKFYDTLKTLEKELKDNSLDPQLAKDIKKYYEDFKQQKKSTLLSKGMDFIKK